LNSVRVLSSGALEGEVKPPPSKSYTHRSVVLASLASGESHLSNVLFSRDTNATISACASMGARIVRSGDALRIIGTKPLAPDDVVNVENSGTTLRFMTSVFSLAEKGYSVLTGDSSIRSRPMQPLLDALGPLGVRAWSARGNGRAPIIVEGGGIDGGETRIRGDVSSQFVSSLLISSVMAERRTTVTVADPVSRPYIDATLATMRNFGVEVERERFSKFDVSPASYRHADFAVPADLSSASFIMAAAAVTGGSVRLENLNLEYPQGDLSIVEILKSMGVKVVANSSSMTVSAGGEKLMGGKFDLRDTPDLLPVVSVLALRSESPVEIVGTAHARFKETDRIAVMATELKKLGVEVTEKPDGLIISPPWRPTSALVDAHDDHRMFMALSIASLMIPGGAPILGVESLDVSYPSFLKDLERIGAKVRSDEK
jgi:3-phosphoshikimate 1-carboxyvinyltransferase